MVKKILDKLICLFRFNSSTFYITGNENLLPPLSKEEEDILVTKYVEEGDVEARNSLIEHNLRLVVYVAKRFDTNITNLEDLISIGTIGLIKAINTYKLDKNIKLLKEKVKKLFFLPILLINLPLRQSPDSGCINLTASMCSKTIM